MLRLLENRERLEVEVTVCPPSPQIRQRTQREITVLLKYAKKPMHTLFSFVPYLKCHQAVTFFC